MSKGDVKGDVKQGLCERIGARAESPLPVGVAAPPDMPAHPPQAHALLGAVAACSPYLLRLMRGEADALADICTRPPEETLDALCADAARAADATEITDAMRILRQAKRRAALLVALADTGGVWSLGETTRALSRFADVALRASVDFCLRETTGFSALALGKHGSCELNYSSDIDLIFLYDADALSGADARRAARAITRLLDETTPDGYVFRVDLRLRPDAEVSPAALSFEAAEHYYESMGAHWERMAFIRARVVAGDRQAGAAFLERLQPFVWRTSIDYAMVDELHAMKHKTHAAAGKTDPSCAGLDIKKCRGGIREIEFFVQAQQLIAGGRDRRLRGASVISGLAGLVRCGWVSRHAARDMAGAYAFLRRLEHRLQMVDDQQTHTLPDTDVGIARIGAFMGYEEGGAFLDALRATRARVEAHDAALFAAPDAETPPLPDDEAMPDALQALGFAPEETARAIRVWRSGRVPAARDTRARALLDECLPSLLKALSRRMNAQEAFRYFDRLVCALPSGMQFFALLRAHPALVETLALICGCAPRLARTLARAPQMLEVLLSPLAAQSAEDATELLNAEMRAAPDFETALDIARRFMHERSFEAGVRLLRGARSSAEAQSLYSDIAETVIRALYEATYEDFAKHYGRIKSLRFAVLALGKLGGREMSAASDLDLIIVYDAKDADAESAGGAASLSVPVYAARFAQRFIGALTVQTAQGALYDVDMRLRPSGRAGPVAVSLARFTAYQTSEAWTWEHMALTRARAVAGDAALSAQLRGVITDVLCWERAPAQIAHDVAELRGRVQASQASQASHAAQAAHAAHAAHPSPGAWDITGADGGLRDAEFLAQYLQLVHAHTHPDLLHVHTAAAFEALHAAGCVSPAEGEALLGAVRLFQTLQQIVRLCVEGDFDPAHAPEALCALMIRAAGCADMQALDKALAAARRAVSESLKAHLTTG